MYDSILLAIDSFASNIAISAQTVFAVEGNVGIMGAFIGAGLAMLGALGVGAGQGVAVGKACEAIARNPEAQPKIMTTMIVGLAIAESAAIYALIIAILLMFAAPSFITK